jgi:hypothetical protein
VFLSVQVRFQGEHDRRDHPAPAHRAEGAHQVPGPRQEDCHLQTQVARHSQKIFTNVKNLSLTVVRESLIFA